MDDLTEQQEVAVAKLGHAITDYLHAMKKEPRLVTGWVLITSTTESQQGQTGYQYLDSHLPWHHAAGLLQFGSGHLDQNFWNLDDDD